MGERAGDLPTNLAVRERGVPGERGKRLRETICEKFGFASLEFQSLEGVIEAIGVDKCKLCTYCWDGRE